MKPIRIFFTFTALFGALPLFSQLENKGWWTRDLFTLQAFHQAESAANNSPERHYLRIFTQPEIGYVLGRRWMAGIVMQFESKTDRYDISPIQNGLKSSKKTFWGAGPLLRYYHPIGKRASFMAEGYVFFSKERNTNISFNQGMEQRDASRRQEFGAGSNPTIVYFLTRNLAFSITFINIGYYATRESQSFTLSVNPQDWLWGLEYYFDRRAENRR